MANLDEAVKAAAAQAQSGRIDLAIPALQQVLKQDPRHVEANRLLAIMFLSTGRIPEGLQQVERAIAAATPPGRADLHHLHGEALAVAGQMERAVEALDKAIELNPNVAQTHALLATCLMQLKDLDGAEEEYAAAIKLQPQHPEARTNYGNVMTMTGRPEEGARILNEAAKDHPTHLGILTNRCVALNYSGAAESGPEEVLRAHQHYGQVVTAAAGGPPMESRAFANVRDPERKIRIGIVSPDLMDHSVSYFVRPMLEHRDRAKTEYVVYSTGGRPDALTGQIQRAVDGWRDMARFNDQQLIAQIRADQVDIVLELSGHTHGNKLSALRLRGAPVQVTYLGYPNTTGVPAIDYRIVDSLTDPAGAERWATEKLIRLDPCFLCYTPREDAPRPGPPPVEANGFVTFGSFNSIKKLTMRTIGMWCRLLKEVPDSRLVIKSSGLSSAAAQEHISGRLREGGVDEERFELLDKMESKVEHLSAYEMMDVALDTFPYHGTTTTCEALWQRVPVVSLVGEVHAARVGLSLLSAIGHPEWAAKSEDEYIAIAAGLGRDPARLARIRGGLRQEMAKSPLCDGAAMGKRMEAALREVWRRWCANG